MSPRRQPMMTIIGIVMTSGHQARGYLTLVWAYYNFFLCSLCENDMAPLCRNYFAKFSFTVTYIEQTYILKSVKESINSLMNIQLQGIKLDPMGWHLKHLALANHTQLEYGREYSIGIRLLFSKYDVFGECKESNRCETTKVGFTTRAVALASELWIHRPSFFAINPTGVYFYRVPMGVDFTLMD